MMDIKQVLLLWFTNFLAKKFDIKNKQLAKELHKPIIKKFKKKKKYLSFKDNIWGADLVDM